MHRTARFQRDTCTVSCAWTPATARNSTIADSAVRKNDAGTIGHLLHPPGAHLPEFPPHRPSC